MPAPVKAAANRPQPTPTTALFVRVPAEQARRLDRAAFALKLPKQRLVAHLLERYVDPDSPTALAALGTTAPQRSLIAAEPDRSTMTVGHHSFRPAAIDVLTAEELAELLQVDLQTVLELAAGGELPGRKLGEQWRFSRAAVLKWLAREQP